ncbi:MAG: adenosylcobinamide-GDP ribazoletransferase, partial [Pseudomonadota bacterium]
AFAVWLLGQLSLQPLVLAGLVVAVQTLSTGALHEDGLADVCDGFGGGSTRDRKLEIMRDSNIGTYGAAGLGLSLLLRAFALAALIAALSPALVASCLLGIAAISRTAMLYQWRTSRPARTDGLARSQSAPTAKSAFIAAALGVLVAIVAFAPSVGIIGTAIAMLISFAVLWGMCRMCERQIGGYTGDTLGAGQQIVEVCLLVSLSSFV